MDIQKYIVKFFPEIMIKGSSAKRQMVGQLYANLTKLLNRVSTNIDIKKFSDKFEVVCPIEHSQQIKTILIQTPGIQQILEVNQYNDMNSLDDIKVKVNELMSNEIINKTFVVRAKRTGTHDFKSTNIEQTVGGYMLHHNDTKGVDLHNPQITIKLQLVNNQLNIIHNTYKGLSGFPLGSQGEILSLMSGGFDSTVASYLTIKRGLKTHYVFFNLGGIAHEIGVKQVAFYIWNKFASSHKVSFITIPFDDVITEIFRSTAPSYMGVTLKRLMIMASEQIADQMGIDALLTGESVAQVSSQTLRNLALIDKVSNKLILRPLSTMHKPEIVDIAQSIGTKHFAENMPEYCGVISQNPIIEGSFKRMENEAKKFDYEVLNKAIENSKKIFVDEIIEDVKTVAKIETITDISNNDFVIIDITDDKECIKTSCETIKIPFYKLKNQFKKLPKEKEYLLYCEKGIMSQLHAQYLQDEEKCTNVRVYRP
jgi:thiamine biosynthesis protein ThiI